MYVCMYVCVYICMYVCRENLERISIEVDDTGTLSNLRQLVAKKVRMLCVYVCVYVCTYVCMYVCMYGCT